MESHVTTTKVAAAFGKTHEKRITRREYPIFLAEVARFIYDLSVSVPQIGVYLADHTFFPIFPDAQPGKKRMLLSTSHPDQECVDIVLIRRDPDFPAGEQRLGNVLLCDIAGATPDASEIEVVLHLHEDGRIDASVRDRLSGNTRDVSFDPDEAVPRREEPAAFDQFAAGGVDSLLDEREPETERSAGGKRWLWLVLALLLLGALAFVLFQYVIPGDRGAGLPDDATDSVELPGAGDSSGGDDADTAATDGDDEAGGTGVEEAEAAAAETAPADEPEPAPARGESAPYQIKWGDTLWDLSRMFYGTPWRFPEIADENDIADPDRIYADDRIRIPRK